MSPQHQQGSVLRCNTKIQRDRKTETHFKVFHFLYPRTPTRFLLIYFLIPTRTDFSSYLDIEQSTKTICSGITHRSWISIVQFSSCVITVIISIGVGTEPSVFEGTFYEPFSCKLNKIATAALCKCRPTTLC